MLSSYPRKFSLSGLTWGLWPCGGQPTSRHPCRRAAVRREGYHMATHVKPRENFLRWYKPARSLHLGRLGCYRVLKLVVAMPHISGEYRCYAVGYGEEGQLFSKDSNVIILNLAGRSQTFVRPYFMKSEVEALAQDFEERISALEQQQPEPAQEGGTQP